MTPDFDIRLHSIIRALQENILPVIAPSEQMAREQAGLAVAQLELLLAQWSHAAGFAGRSLADSLEFGRELLAVPGTDACGRAGAQLAAVLDRAAGLHAANPKAAWEMRDQVAAAIDGYIEAHAAAAEPIWLALARVVLAQTTREHDRSRAWFAGTRLDPECAELPAITTVV